MVVLDMCHGGMLACIAWCTVVLPRQASAAGGFVHILLVSTTVHADDD